MQKSMEKNNKLHHISYNTSLTIRVDCENDDTDSNSIKDKSDSKNKDY